MKKIVLTKQIYELYQELERLEDVLIFSSFRTLDEAFESHHFLPGFYVDDIYYEIHDNDNNELEVLRFSPNARLGEEGYEVEGKYLDELIESLKKL